MIPFTTHVEKHITEQRPIIVLSCKILDWNYNSCSCRYRFSQIVDTKGLGCSKATLVLEYAHSQDNAGQIIFLKNVLMGIRLPPPQALLFSGKFMGRRYAAGKVGVSGLDGRNCGFLNILQLNRYPMHWMFWLQLKSNVWLMKLSCWCYFFEKKGNSFGKWYQNCLLHFIAVAHQFPHIGFT